MKIEKYESNYGRYFFEYNITLRRYIRFFEAYSKSDKSISELSYCFE